jgi:sec-independent protein translocase protein TatB
MFDLGFSEMMLIGIVALIVIGPERLPKVARTAGQWLGRLNRYVSQVKQDIDRDMKLEELRKMQQEMKDTAQRYEIMAGETQRELETAVEQQTGQISRVMQAMSATDGGLAMQEWDKIKAEEAAAAAIAAPASTASASSSATPRIAAVDGVKVELPTRQPEQPVALAPPDNKATS